MIQCNQTITALNFKSLIGSNSLDWITYKLHIPEKARTLMLIAQPQSPHKIFFCSSYVDMQWSCSMWKL